MVLIVTTAVMCVMIMVGTDEDPIYFGERLKNYPLAIVFIILPCLPGFIFVGIMLFFHSYLIANDLTTKEVLDEKWTPLLGNPERKNFCFKNIAKLFLKTQESKSKYKHKAFTYYNNEAEDSSNTGNQKNSKGSDPESSGKRKEKNINYSSSEESIQKHPAEKVDIEEKIDVVEEVETEEKIQV